MGDNSGEKVREILDRAKETLGIAEQGLRDLKGPNPSRRRAGLANAITFGRAVTNVLQGLRGTRQDFDQWYGPYQEEMKKDPLLRYFYEWRSEVLKSGRSPATTVVEIKNFTEPEASIHFGPRPKYGTDRFIGDSAGGSGWNLQYPDGSKAKLYVDFPSDIAEVSIQLKDPPKQHLDKPIQDFSAANLVGLYAEYLRRMVRDAFAQFSPRKI